MIGVRCLSARMGRVSRRRANDPTRGHNVLIYLPDGVTKAIEEADVIGCDLDSLHSIGLLRQKFAGLQYAFRRTIAIGTVLLCKTGDNILYP